MSGLPQKVEMPRACPVESSRWTLLQILLTSELASGGLCLKSRNRTWIGSVPSAVADGSMISVQYFLTILTAMVDPSATADGTDPIQQ